MTSSRILANIKNIGKAIKNRRPVEVNGGIVSTAILKASHVVPQTKQRMTNKIAIIILVVYQTGFRLFLSDSIMETLILKNQDHGLSQVFKIGTKIGFHNLIYNVSFFNKSRSLSILDLKDVIA